MSSISLARSESSSGSENSSSGVAGRTRVLRVGQFVVGHAGLGRVDHVTIHRRPQLCSSSTISASTISASTMSSSFTEPAPVESLWPGGRRTLGPGVAGGGLVELLAERLAGRHQRVGGRLDGRAVGSLERLLEVGERLLDGFLLVGGHLVALLAQHLLGLVDERVGVVADLGLLTALAVVLGVGLGVLDHLLDVVLVERRLTGDGHRLFLVGRPVLGRHVDDAVGVDVEGDLDLRDATGRRRQVDELELAERLVVARHLALALDHVDLDRRLAVFGGGEHLGALGGDGGVALDELGHHAALGLDAEAQRGDVEQQDVLDVAAQHAGLDRRADGDDLVGVDRLVRLLAGEALHEIGHGRHAGRAADEDHVVQVALLDAGVLEGLLERDAATLHQVGGHLLELGARQRLVEVQRAVGRGRDERQVDLGLLDLAEVDLGLLGGFLQALGGHAVGGRGRRRAPP